ncbi:MAG: methionyl-tRNA formyltransferase [Actinobacteria bacterium]|nr:methionyl-tRNA formyltransferase [Actinomycetota bacterium]
MKVIFIGTPKFALPTLEALINSSYKPELVITQPDRQKGRNLKPAPPPVKETALSHNIPVLQPFSIKSEDIKTQIEEIKPDFIVVAAYGQIIPGWLLSCPKYGCINVHASLLPKYRGAAPIQRAIMDGCEKTGITTMLMDEGMDTGKILLQKEVEISSEDTAETLENKLSETGAVLLLETLDKLIGGLIEPLEQNDDEATYANKIPKEETEIKWELPSEKIRDFVRALNPSPAAYTYYKNKRIKVFKVSSPLAKGGHREEPPFTKDNPPLPPFTKGGQGGFFGEIVSVDKKLIVATGDGFLELVEVQPESKKRMSGEEFIRGYHLEISDKFEP